MMWGIGAEPAEPTVTWTVIGSTLRAERTTTVPRSKGAELGGGDRGDRDRRVVVGATLPGA